MTVSQRASAWPRQRDMRAFYGDPDANGDGQADPAWVASNIVRITPPYRMVLAWDKGRQLRSISVHKKCAGNLTRILERIRDLYGSQAALEAARLHLYGGAYNFRLKRGGSTLSTHAYGAAIDLDPERNAFGRKYGPRAGMMPVEVVKIFQSEGWDWGGLWHKGDAMHFQAAGSGSGQDISAIGRVTTKGDPVVWAIQEALVVKGYPEVGLVDGLMGSKTRGAILAFQADNERPTTGKITPDLLTQILGAPVRTGNVTRVAGRPEKSRIVDNSNVGIGVAAAGGVGVALEKAAPIIEQVEQGSGMVSRVTWALRPVLPYLDTVWPWLLAAGVVGLGYLFWRSRQARIEDFRTGKTAR
jgi:D-alanyl-D-alanine carboxypeptidase-like protein/putative peptidoglycan binding protein